MQREKSKQQCEVALSDDEEKKRVLVSEHHPASQNKTLENYSYVDTWKDVLHMSCDDALQIKSLPLPHPYTTPSSS